MLYFTNAFLINIFNIAGGIPYRYFFIFLVTMYLYIITLDFNSDRRFIFDEVNVITDRSYTLKTVEQMYQVHNFLVAIFYFGNNCFEPVAPFWGLSTLKIATINVFISNDKFFT
jgi:hypothetical protein